MVSWRSAKRKRQGELEMNVCACTSVKYAFNFVCEICHIKKKKFDM